MDPSWIVRWHMEQLYDDIWEHFDRTRYDPWKDVLEFIEGCDGERALDLASGNGRHAPALLERGFEVHCVDLCTPLLGSAMARMAGLGGGHAIRGDATAVPLSDDSVDTVLYIAGLHHLPTQGERLGSLSEVKRVLRTGGRGLISTWSEAQTNVPKEELVRSLDTPWGLVELDGNDWFIPWKADGSVRYRYYHLFSEEGLDTLVGSVFKQRETFVSGNNVFSIIET